MDSVNRRTPVSRPSGFRNSQRKRIEQGVRRGRGRRPCLSDISGKARHAVDSAKLVRVDALVKPDDCGVSTLQHPCQSPAIGIRNLTTSSYLNPASDPINKGVKITTLHTV
ncbi:hypothetical protein J6590_033744 [Homalodisca vitripennis]|nr:hypothetical protein J6590_033744 [Homalodisca vitripennis]